MKETPAVSKWLFNDKGEIIPKYKDICRILKTWQPYFQEIIDGKKTFEIRKSLDRDFRVDDFLLLRETTIDYAEFCLKDDPDEEFTGEIYTGREQFIKITYITSFGQPENQVVFSFKLIISVRDL